MVVLQNTANAPVQIAGGLTAADWQKARAAVTANPIPGEWDKVFIDFFQQRLTLRYLNPIQTLQDNDSYSGEGFAIAAIQCSLIEFLAATLAGKNYRYIRKGEPALDLATEYSNSSELFTNFLAAEAPFSNEFDAACATDFYASVRCGLLHEARTKNGWTIWAQSEHGSMIDPAQKTLFRNGFQQAILNYLAAYRARLVQEALVQEAFIRKYDSLCRN